MALTYLEKLLAKTARARQVALWIDSEGGDVLSIHIGPEDMPLILCDTIPPALENTETHVARRRIVVEGGVRLVVAEHVKGGCRIRQAHTAEGLADSGPTVDCPVIGDIPRVRCLEHQFHASADVVNAASPMRVKLNVTCPTCPNRVAEE